MPNINAALAYVQLEQLEKYIQNKRETASSYQDFFENIANIEYIKEPTDSRSNFWLNAIRFSSKSERDDFLNFSNDNSIMTRPIWKLMSHLAMFKDCPQGDLSVSEALENTIVNIPNSGNYE